VTRGRVAAGGLLLVALAHAPAHPADPPDPPERVIRYANDTLTVRLTHEPVSEVLQEISRQTGAEIVGQPMEVRDVSADFEAVPMSDALRRLLGNENFALVYGEKGRLKAVKLLGGPQVVSTSTGRATMIPTTTLPEPSEEDTAVSLLDTPVTLLMGSRLARQLGRQTAPLRQVLEVGLRSPDATVRADTVRVALQTIEKDPRLRTAAAETVGGQDDATLSDALRSVAGDHAGEVASLVASQTKIIPLRVKANNFLRAQAGQ
jgi:hypothetical protein